MKTSALAALDEAESLLILAGFDSVYVRGALRAIRAARAEILRQAVEAAETFRETTRRDPARRGTSA
jgi:hypothetical protein